MFVFLLLRLQEYLGEQRTLERVPSKRLYEFVRKHKKSIVSFDNNVKPIKFATYAINTLKDEIGFAIGTERDGIGYGCEKFPCVVPFKNGRQILGASVAPEDPTNFTLWCMNVFNDYNIDVKHPEMLRKILMDENSVVIGVNMSNRPDFIKKKMFFYSVDQSLFAKIGVNNVEKGYYYYNADEKIMRELNQSMIDYEKYITSLKDEKLKSKSFWGGYIVDDDNDENSEIEYNIMRELGKKYKGEINMVPIYENSLLLKEARILFFEKSSFVIFDSKKEITNRYVMLKEENTHKIKNVELFVNKIIQNKIKTSTLSVQTKKSETSFRKLNYNNFWHTINNDNSDSLVYFYSNKYNSPKSAAVVKKSIELINANTIKCYEYDLSHNDIPIDLEISKAPNIFFFSKNRKPGFHEYKFSYRVDMFIDWLTRVSTSSIKVPLLDVDKSSKKKFFDF